MKHEKKVWPGYFQDIVDGKKTFECRLADWECKEDDILVLKERDPKTRAYTDRSIEKKVTFVFKTKDGSHFFSPEDIEKYGYQIIAFK